MSGPKGEKSKQRRVWRMSPDNPGGAYVLVADRAGRSTDRLDTSEQSFLASSLDLVQGIDMSEADLDTLPGELADLFTKTGR